MARSRVPPQRPSASLTIRDMQLAVPRLNKRIAEVREFQPEAIASSDEASSKTAVLKASISDALARTFGADSVEYHTYGLAARFSWPITVGNPTPIQRIRECLVRDKARSIELLQAAVASLEEQMDELGGSTSPNAAPMRPAPLETRKIFLVHGHDTSARETVARFLERCGFEPVILHEQANQGRTIIEKFEANADVGFAVVLLTPDDEVIIPNGGSAKRARQNVILELGYFIGRLGRDRVCALKNGELELPSDIFGVVWTDFDTNGAWKLALAKELQAANFEVDWNQVMRS